MKADGSKKKVSGWPSTFKLDEAGSGRAIATQQHGRIGQKEEGAICMAWHGMASGATSPVHGGHATTNGRQTAAGAWMRARKVHPLAGHIVMLFSEPGERGERREGEGESEQRAGRGKEASDRGVTQQQNSSTVQSWWYGNGTKQWLD